MADHDTHDHTGVPGVGTDITEILDIPTAETDAALVLAPDGAGGVEFRAEAGGTSGVLSDNCVATSQNFSGNNSWANLTTTGPAVTVTVPASGAVRITIGATMSNNNVAGYQAMGFAISGANTQAAGTANPAGAVMEVELGTSTGTTLAPAATLYGTWLITGLTPGSTTFTAKYNQFGTPGTANFAARYMLVETVP